MLKSSSKVTPKKIIVTTNIEIKKIIFIKHLFLKGQYR